MRLVSCRPPPWLCAGCGRLLLLLVMLVGLVVPAVAQDEAHPGDTVTRFRAALSAEERAWLDAHPVLRAGNGPDFQPFYAWQAGDRYAGPNADYLELLGRRTGLQFRMVRFPEFPAVLHALDSGAIDLIPTLTPTESRRKRYRFTGGYMHSPAVLVTRSSGGPTGLPADLRGVRIAIERGHASREVLLRTRPGARLVDVDDAASALQAVATGEADAYVGLLAVAHYYMERLSLANLQVRQRFDADLSAMAMAVPRDQTLLAGILRKAMAFVSDAEGHALLRRYLPTGTGIPGEAFHLTAAEQAWLQAHGPIRVGYDQAFYPLSYTNLHRQAEGYSIELFRLLRDKVGLSVDEVAGTWSAVLDKALRNELDVLVGVASTPERREKLLFVGPYLTTPTAIVTHSDFQQVWDLGEFAGRKLALLESHFLRERIRSAYPTIQLVEVPTQEDALRRVAAGSADAAIGNLYAINRLIQSHFLGKLYIAGHVPDGDSELYLGVQPAAPELAAILGRALEALSPADIATARNRWLDTRYMPELPVRRFALYLTVPLAALVILLAISAFMTRRLRRALEACQAREASLAEQFETLAGAHARMEAVTGAVARDLRRPAFSLDDQVDLLRDALVHAPAKVPAALDRLAEASRRIRAALVGLEGLAGSAAPPPRRAPVNLAALATALWPDLMARHGQGHAVRLDCAGGPQVTGDPVLLRGVVRQLLSNAVKFSRHTLDARVTLRTLPGGAHGFEIADNGPGIPPAEVAALFQPYQRLSNAGRVEGAGIGLAVARQLARRMGGDIQLVAQAGGGACFRVSLEVQDVVPAGRPV
ncbi:MAG TPA: transporter substrate-binding domain-containing protein [Zoogloea sp.]|uniref:transporter substrate-binding domain-containing protein n=1 Tax=Zoogloea sp. TaxID=49181 RepID=UPI002CBD28E6|nr:transporter substrate-binding domain-containing protein [Zoogloea sp.]HNC79410.1 transporter substrate-binding domain-containing protein [Rhodocyclaceae bacterium]HNE17007.1 transporter substrate-binding domain-containing protein [Rhodocyclaceae bacterium]HNF62124.1 transporter substrate-binding domain-containing protein [Rhodocyclaceae bacterium]HNH16730.1 transporter substrate-binding domain-containing protein [Zoogloea sp.]HNI48214.1 transporter substrate-binding domain-containing protei